MHSIRLPFVTPAQPPRYAGARSPAAAGRRRLILLGFLCGFLLAFAAPRICAQYVDDHNPVGVAGTFEGVATTGCAYNVLSHSTSRAIDDIVVPGSIGKYPLKMTRYYASRSFASALGPGWRHEYLWSSSQAFGQGKVEYPNGNVWDSYCEDPVGVSDWPVPPGQYTNGAFRLADGGTVVWDAFGRASQIIDPYGQTTTIQYDNTNGAWMKVIEPGGRYLYFIYTHQPPPNGALMLTRVEAHGLGNATVTDWVNYTYTSKPTGGQTITSAMCLTRADYSDSTSATYTYEYDNVPEQPTRGSIRFCPPVSTCNDVRYHGPMRRIAYNYDQGGPHGAITAERYSSGDGVKGLTVSSISPALPPPLSGGPVIQMPTDFTETRGDGPTRTFSYTWLHVHRDPESSACPTLAGLAPSQFLQSYTDFRGQTTYLGYDANWYVNSVTDANNYTTYYTRGPNIGEITQIQHPGDNSTINYAYTDSGHYVSQITDERGNMTVYTRDGNQRITRIDHKDSQGNVLAYEEFQYANNNFGLLSTHHLPSTPNWSGPYVHFQYNGRGLLVAKTNPTTIADWQTAINSPQKTTYIYYTSGPWVDRVQTMTLPANVNGLQASETYEYDKNAAGTNVPGRGLVTKITHNDNNRTYQSFGYDAYGNKLWEENELRRRTSYTYDEYNRLLTVTRPLNGITTYTYNPTNGTGSPYKHTTNNPDTITTATNIVTRNVYDQNFRKVSTAVGSSTTTFGYDNVGNPTTVTDPLIHTTTTIYDERNRKATVADALNRTTTFTYDGASNVVSILRPDTYTETKAYDAMNRLISHTTPKSAGVSLTTTFGYWPSGKLFWVKDPKQQGTNLATFLQYNESDQMIAMYYPDPGLNVLQQWAYDDAHNLKNRTTVNGEIQYFTYDIRNRKTGMSWSNNVDWASFTYYADSRLYTAQNGNSTVTRQYDDAGRLTLDQQNVNGLGTVSVNYGYDDDGKENHLWVPGANPSYDYTYGYDAMGRFETIRPGGNIAFQYYYDAASNESRRHNYLSSTQLDQFYNRDELNRIWRLEVKRGATLLGREDYGYDVMNRLISVTREDNKQDQFGYYRDGELSGVLYGTSPTPTPSPPPSPTPPPGGTPTPTPPGGQVATPTFVPDGGYVSACANSYTYNVTISTSTSGAQIRWTIDGSMPSPTHGTLINGSSGVASFGVGLQPKTLRAIAFKTGMTNSNIKSADYSFERDCGQGPGEPTKEETTVDDLLSLPEGVDPESLQTADRTVTYYYDNAGSRTTVNDSVNGNTSYTPNSFNQYTAVSGSTISNGNEHEIASYRNIDYSYLNDEHLIGVTNRNVTPNDTYDLRYDALGRCVKRTVNGLTKYYIYDGEKPILEYNPSAQIIGRNVYGKGIDEILMRTDYTFSPALTFYYQQDHEGSVTHLTSTIGNILEKYRYDVYGAPTIYPPAPGATPIPVSSYSNRFMFTGREYSNMFGFYEYRARAYHAGLGRFMSEDPKLFDAGDYNLFRYCHNDPVDFTDPLGLEVGFGESLIPVWGSGHMAYDAFNEGHYAMAAFHTAMAITDVSGVKALGSIAVKSGLKSLVKTEIGRTVTKTVEQKAATGYRYVSMAEAKAIKDSGMRIPTVNKVGEPKPVFFTNERFSTRADAQKALSMPSAPEFRVEFNMKQAPAGYGGLTEGGHAEFTLREGAQPITANKIVPLSDTSHLDLDQASRHIPPKYDQ
jgi:RHS repeat-associated protein